MCPDPIDESELLTRAIRESRRRLDESAHLLEQTADWLDQSAWGGQEELHGPDKQPPQDSTRNAEG
jgi:hypothetical protein